MNSTAYRKAMNLLDGQSRPIFIADPTGKIPGTILGYPVLRCDALPESEVWFGDLKGYWIGYRGGISVAKSTDATIEGIGNLFERNMFAIRVERRVDGELADLDSMVVITGAN
jgi:HK97 family phage major capsid protein